MLNLDKQPQVTQVHKIWLLATTKSVLYLPQVLTMAGYFYLIFSCLMFAHVQGFPTSSKPTSLVPTELTQQEDLCSSKALVSELRQIVNEAPPTIRYLGDIPAYAASSCAQLFQLRPNVSSSYYWIQKSTGAVRVYCKRDGSEFGEKGPWMRIAHVDMTDPVSKCPAGLDLHRVNSERLCRKNVDIGCSSAMFSTHEVPFKKICGKVIGIQHYSVNGFQPYYAQQSKTIDDLYVEGVSITYSRSPRQHIWTFAAGQDETPQNIRDSCPCMNSRSFVAYTGLIPEFIGDDYYCETGSSTSVQNRYYLNDPLWDGEGCGRFSTCCEGERKPWFCKEFPQQISSDIEVRVCVDEPRSHEDVLLRAIELYIQ